MAVDRRSVDTVAQLVAAGRDSVDTAVQLVAADRRSVDTVAQLAAGTCSVGRAYMMRAVVMKIVDMVVDTAVTSMSSPYNSILKI